MFLVNVDLRSVVVMNVTVSTGKFYVIDFFTLDSSIWTLSLFLFLFLSLSLFLRSALSVLVSWTLTMTLNVCIFFFFFFNYLIYSFILIYFFTYILSLSKSDNKLSKFDMSFFSFFCYFVCRCCSLLRTISFSFSDLSTSFKSYNDFFEFVIISNCQDESIDYN